MGFASCLHRFTLPIAALLILLAACERSAQPAGDSLSGPDATIQPAAQRAGAIGYPTTRRVDVVDNYHGTEVADPYRWLEDDVRVSGEVAEWVRQQNTTTDAYLETLALRKHFRDRLAALWNYQRFGLPERRGERYFYSRNDGLQNQSVLYVQDGLDGDPRVLIDPNTWSEDGTVNLAEWVPSPDGRYLAYGIQDGGSDWRTWRVLDVESGNVMTDELTWLKFTSVAWTHDKPGFYYSRYPAPDSDQQFQSLNLDHKVFYHTLGEDQAEDQLIHERTDQPEWGFFPTVTDDGRFLIITIFHGTDNRYRVAWKDLREPDSPVTTLIDEFRHDYTIVGNIDDRLFFLTNEEAPKYRLVAIDLHAPEARTEIIAQAEHVLQGVSHIGGHFIAAYLEDAKSVLRVFDPNGASIHEVALPGIGSAAGFGGEPDEAETFYSFSSFNQPPTLYRYNVESGESAAWQTAEVDFDPEAYLVRQAFYTSRDGTEVPLFIAHRKDLDPTAPAATLLYGYGGFNISLTPSFAVPNLAWMEAGGVYVQANLRGGGEYGRQWHQAGTKTNKQNVFDDFIAAAEYLIATGITDADHLGIHGRSNGGLLVGAVTNQRPELFAAALPAVGVMDMLRFDQFTAGRFWVDDYGSSSNAEEFPALYAYSPYHNIAEGKNYPAVLVTTADTDDRVVPGHSFKYAAALQAAETGSAPKLVRIETRAGHGAGTPVGMLIDLYADQWAFLAEHTGLSIDPES